MVRLFREVAELYTFHYKINKQLIRRKIKNNKQKRTEYFGGVFLGLQKLGNTFLLEKGENFLF